MSVIVRCQPEQDFSVPHVIDPTISLAAGVSAAKALTEIFMELGQPDVDVRIGWPNDILIENRKIAGALVEGCLIENKSPFAVVGFGINLNNKSCSFPGELKNTSTSVFDIAQAEYPVRKACEKLLDILDKTIKHIRNYGIEDTLSEWRARSAAIGREVTIFPHGEPPYNAIPLDIDSTGRLIVQIPTGETRLLNSEEVTIARKMNSEVRI
jgi:BirA family biotin operon repressor/biotin-[acetyl-CoA-carboxylase] ligase